MKKFRIMHVPQYKWLREEDILQFAERKIYLQMSISNYVYEM